MRDRRVVQYDRPCDHCKEPYFPKKTVKEGDTGYCSRRCYQEEALWRARQQRREDKL